MTDRCQGCGISQGVPIVVKKGTKRRKSVVEPTALIMTALVDYGMRRLCQRCRKGAHEAAGRLHHLHRTILRA
jgi:hypothetical protein